MPRKKNRLTEELITAPFWVSLVLAALSYLFFSSILPRIAINNPILQGIASSGGNFAPLAAIFFVFLAVVSFARGLRIKTQFKRQKSVDTLNDLGWKEFEDITGEYFRRRGYSVEENLRPGADGGVDLRLRKNGQLILVQCKRWKKQKVKLQTVRELLGAITAEKAHSGILVTTSTFTSEAVTFARKHGIQLINGETLAAGIGKAQGTNKKPHARTAPPPMTPASAAPAPSCPRCGSPMLVRTAKQGQNAGKDFWGCRSFPRCRGTVNI